jgi:hypothetical protein
VEAKVLLQLMAGYVISYGRKLQSYQSGSSSSAYGLIFLGAHFIWAFSLMFLFSGRGYGKNYESIVWAHNKLNFSRFNHVH